MLFFFFFCRCDSALNEGKKHQGQTRPLALPGPWGHSGGFIQPHFFYIKRVLHAPKLCEIFISTSLKFAAGIRWEGNLRRQTAGWFMNQTAAAGGSVNGWDVWHMNCRKCCLFCCAKWRPCDLLWLRNASHSSSSSSSLFFIFFFYFPSSEKTESGRRSIHCSTTPLVGEPPFLHFLRHSRGPLD